MTSFVVVEQLVKFEFSDTITNTNQVCDEIGKLLLRI